VQTNPKQYREGYLRNAIPAAFVAMVFIFLCSTAIEGQGIYYDEVHQAPSSFLLLGKKVDIMNNGAVRGFPVLNMQYSGAIKSNLFGVWMRATGRPFSIVSWRLFGILLVAGGLFLFLILSHRALTMAGAAFFSFFLLTDVTVLLTSRHDWGPTALAMNLRLVWLGIWLRDENDARDSSIRPFLLGFLPALLVFEKLNNVVLLGPLAWFFLLTGRRSPRRVALIGAGFLAGLVPLAVTNLLFDGVSLKAYRWGASIPTGDEVSFKGMFKFLVNYLVLGDGRKAKSFILGVSDKHWWSLELGFVTFSLFVVAWVALRYWRTDRRARLCGVSLLSYLSVAVLIYWSLPMDKVKIIHTIVGTPFQYLAISLAVPILFRDFFGVQEKIAPTFSDKLSVIILAFVLSGFVALRVFQVAAVERNLERRVSSVDWDPSFTKVALFVVGHYEEGSFVSGDWGFATQIFVLSNGAIRIPEPFFNPKHVHVMDPRRQKEILRLKPGKPVYVLLRRGRTPVSPDGTDWTLQSLRALCGEKTLSLETELAALEGVEVIKFPPPR
jgi:hypothetical protein